MFDEHGDSEKVYMGAPEMVRMCDVKREAIWWIWPGRLPAGKLVMLAGDPGLGKSFLTMDIAARLSSGRLLPDQSGAEQVRAPMDVVILSAEDDPGDTIRPRLEDAGAELYNVHMLEGVRFSESGIAGAIRLDRDAEAVYRALRRCGNPGLVIIDPITAYLGQIDANSNADVRKVLRPLSKLAEKTGVCVLCVTHLNKATQSKTIYRSMGSLAFTAAARMAWLVAKDPSRPEDRVLAPIKSNISGSAPGLRYRITQKDGDSGPTVEYQIDTRPITLEDLEQTGAEGDQPGELDEAVSWLTEALTGGAVGAKEIVKQAGEVGISKRTLARAKRELGVRSARHSGGTDGDGSWSWIMD